MIRFLIIILDKIWLGRKKNKKFCIELYNPKVCRILWLQSEYLYERYKMQNIFKLSSNISYHFIWPYFSILFEVTLDDKKHQHLIFSKLNFSHIYFLSGGGVFKLYTAYTYKNYVLHCINSIFTNSKFLYYHIYMYICMHVSTQRERHIHNTHMCRGIWQETIEDVSRMFTCFTIVTAVVPLQKQSIVGCNFNSLSINLKAFKNDLFSGRYMSGSFSFSWTSNGSHHSSSMLGDAVSSILEFPFAFSVVPRLLSSLFELAFHWVHSIRGRESRTFLATIWPNGPWPSNTPQNIVSFLVLKFCSTNIVTKSVRTYSN